MAERFDSPKPGGGDKNESATSNDTTLLHEEVDEKSVEVDKYPIYKRGMVVSSEKLRKEHNVPPDDLYLRKFR